MIEVIAVGKSYGGLKALDGCSFKVQERTITGLIGPNGAGKTTLFHLLTGFYNPIRVNCVSGESGSSAFHRS